MYQLAHVANTILYKAKSEGMNISPMKLQKLLYYLYAEHLYRTGESLFSERFEPWQYGPVLDDVYQAFKQYGSKPIKSYMPDANGRNRAIILDKDPGLCASFDEMWHKYSNRTGIELSTMTHVKHGAWYEALSQRQPFLSDEAIKREIGAGNRNEQPSS